MQYIVKYIKQMELLNKIIDYINHIRLFKRMMLPVELVSANRTSRTDAFQDIKAKSLIEQKFSYSEVPKPTIIAK